LNASSASSHANQRSTPDAWTFSMQEGGSFRSLKVWQASMDLVEDVYRVTARFPVDERFGLAAQIRRACVSIVSNIGEGKRRQSRGARRHHFDIALGSQGEVEVQLDVARRVGLLAEPDYQRLQESAEAIGRMLSGLMTALREEQGERAWR
jgi:four helix bundle protein